MKTTQKMLLGDAAVIAARAGWNWTSTAENGGSRVTLECLRGRERMHFTAWSANGEISQANGQVATGIYSLEQIRENWPPSEKQIENWLRRPAASDWSNNSGFDLEVSEGLVRESWETACNYTEKRLIAGRYPLELQSLEYQRTGEGRPYYARAVIPAVAVREFYVNRVFTASKAHDNELDERPSSHDWTIYAYQLPEAGQTREIGDLFRIVPATTETED